MGKTEKRLAKNRQIKTVQASEKRKPHVRT